MSARRNCAERLIWSTAILTGLLVGPVLGEDLAPAEDGRERRPELVVHVLQEVVAVALRVAQPLVAPLELLVEPRVAQQERGLVGVALDRRLVLRVESARLVRDAEDPEDPDLGLERREDVCSGGPRAARTSACDRRGSDRSLPQRRLPRPVHEHREARVLEADPRRRAGPRRGSRSPAGATTSERVSGSQRQSQAFVAPTSCAIWRVSCASVSSGRVMSAAVCASRWTPSIEAIRQRTRRSTFLRRAEEPSRPRPRGRGRRTSPTAVPPRARPRPARRGAPARARGS